MIRDKAPLIFVEKRLQVSPAIGALSFEHCGARKQFQIIFVWL